MIKALLFAGAVAAVAACTPVDKVYRPLSYAEPDCPVLRQHPTALEAVDNDEEKLPPSWMRCMGQIHVNPAPSASKPRLDRKNDYHLAYVEFGEDGRALLDRQREELLAHLASQRRNYVIVYVHGWRHDAALGDNDARRFRVLLSYARSFLHERCEKAGRYCHMSVTGVYVGWRGRSFVDCDQEDRGTLCDVAAAPTIWDRKAASDRIAKPVTAAIKDIEGALALRTGDPFSGDRMLVLGHSFGGNVLAKGLKESFLDKVAGHRPGRPLASPLGDLVVLFNPASEAENWTAIQRQVRERGEGREVFSARQKPVYLSLTSTCNWPEAVRDKDHDLHRDIACDRATGTLFPLHKALSLQFGREQRTTIGQLDPERGEDPVGTTHELDINPETPLTTAAETAAHDLDRSTSYRNAVTVQTSECLIADAWLTRAKARAKAQQLGRNWDAGYGRRNALAPINRTLRIGLDGQFRHGLYRGREEAVTTANDPFWNVRALDSAVIGHTGFVNYPTWCALNQLVLDDITGDKPFPPRGTPSRAKPAPRVALR